MDPAPLFSGYEYSGNKYSCAENHMSHKQHMDLWDTDSFFSAEKFWRCGSIIFCIETLEMRVDYFLQRNPGNAEQSYPVRR